MQRRPETNAWGAEWVESMSVSTLMGPICEWYVSFLLATKQIILFVEPFLQCSCLRTGRWVSAVASPSRSKALIGDPTGSQWAVLRFKHSAAIKRVVSRTLHWQSQRGVVTQDRSPTSAPDLCSEEDGYWNSSCFESCALLSLFEEAAGRPWRVLALPQRAAMKNRPGLGVEWK